MSERPLFRIAMALLVLCLTDLSARAELPAEVRSDVEACLSGQAPIPHDGFLHWGSSGADALRDIIADPEHWLESRAQALHVLAATFPTPETRALLEKTLANRELCAPFLRRHTLEALVAAFKSEAFPALKRHLNDPDLRVRETAATLLANAFPAQAKPLLEARRRLETDPFIQRRLDALLKKLAD